MSGVACGNINLDDSDLYDNIVSKDREYYRKLANTGPKCMMNFNDIQGGDIEHFGNLTKSNKWIKNLLLIIVVIIVLYLIYSICLCGNSVSNYDNDATYWASFVRN
jgi:hypothetical protein